MQETIDKFLGQMAAQGRSRNTLSAYRSDLYRFSLYLQEMHPALAGWPALTHSSVAAYIAHLQKAGHSPSTITRKGVVLNRFFAFLGSALRVDEKLLDTGLQSSATVSSALLNSEEIARLLAHAAQLETPTARRDWALLALLWATAAQVSEVTGLNQEDFDPLRGRIVLGRGGPRQRTRSLSPEVTEAIVDYLTHDYALPPSAPPGAPLFCNQRGHRLTRQGLWLIVGRVAQPLAFHKRLTPRTLRRSALARLSLEGASSLTLDGAPVAIN